MEIPPESKVNHKYTSRNSISESADVSNSEHNEPTNSSGSLTADQLEILEQDIAQSKLIYGDLHNSSIPFFKNLFINGLSQPIDFSVPLNDKPDWLDAEKFNQGRTFAKNNMPGILFAELISTILLFPIKLALPPLIFTHATDSPFKCFIRYTSTFKRLKSWYDEDIWANDSEAKKNLRVVRSMHKNLHVSMSSCSEDELKKKILLKNNHELSDKFVLYKIVKEEAKKASDFTPKIPLDEISKEWISQSAMCFVQWAFAGLVVTYPQKFGVHRAKKDDLEAFAHFWRALGYMLGIKDEFNIFTGDLETVRGRTKSIINLVIKPALKEVTPEWEYMSRCLVDGGNFFAKGINFESVILYAFHVISLEITPNLKKHLTLGQLFRFYFTIFFFEYFCKLPIISKLINFIALRGVRMFDKVSPKILSQWKKKKFFYVPNDDD